MWTYQNVFVEKSAQKQACITLLSNRQPHVRIQHSLIRKCFFGCYSFFFLFSVYCYRSINFELMLPVLVLPKKPHTFSNEGRVIVYICLCVCVYVMVFVFLFHFHVRHIVPFHLYPQRNRKVSARYMLYVANPSDTLPADNASNLKIMDFVCETRTILYKKMWRMEQLTIAWFIGFAIIKTACYSQFSKVERKNKKRVHTYTHRLRCYASHEF